MTRQKALVFGFLIFSPFALMHAQWAKAYGKAEGAMWEYVNCIVTTIDGGFIVAGNIDIRTDLFAHDSYFWIMKLSSEGDLGWQRTFGVEGYEQANSIRQLEDGGYIVCGDSADFFVVFKIDYAGSVIWARKYNAFVGYCKSLDLTADGGFVVAGGDFGVMKLSSDGGIEWQKEYGPRGTKYAAHFAVHIEQAADGGYILMGWSDEDVCVLKLSSQGAIQWQNRYDGSEYDRPYSIQQTKDGGFIISADTQSPSSSNMDVWVLKLDDHGRVEWQACYGGADGDYAGEIRQTADGGYVLTGGTSSDGSGNSGAFLLKLSPAGSIEWQRTYVGGHGSSVKQIDDFGYVVAGSCGYFVEGYTFDYQVLRFSASGDIPGCEDLKNANFSIRKTTVLPQMTSFAPFDTGAISQPCYLSVPQFDIKSIAICPWKKAIVRR